MRLDRALALAGDRAPAQLRAHALAMRALLWGRSAGAPQKRRADLLEALRLARVAGAAADEIEYLAALSSAAAHAGDHDAAIGWAADAVARARERGDEALTGKALAARAAAEPGHPQAAERAREAAAALLRAERLSDAHEVLAHVGYAALAAGRPDEALELMLETVPLVEAIDRAVERYFTDGNLALAYLLLGRDAEAAEALRRAFEHCRRVLPEHLLIDELLRTLAALAGRAGELEEAARLAAAGHAHAPPVLDAYERTVDERLEADYLRPARARLGERRWDRIAAAAARLDQADALALGVEAARRLAAALAPAQ